MELVKKMFSVSYEISEMDFIRVGGKGVIVDTGMLYGGSIKIRVVNRMTVEDEHLGIKDIEEDLIIRVNTESKDNDDEVKPLNMLLRDYQRKNIPFVVQGGIPKNYNGEVTAVAFENCKQMYDRLSKLLASSEPKKS